MQELLEVRLDGVLVLAQRGADVLGLDGLVQGALLLFELHQALRHRLANESRLDDLHEVRKAFLDLTALGLQAIQVARIAVVLLVVTASSSFSLRTFFSVHCLRRWAEQ